MIPLEKLKLLLIYKSFLMAPIGYVGKDQPKKLYLRYGVF
jgi:hypothetical protein